MRANTVLSSLMRCIEWCDNDMPKANTRGNYKSTRNQMVQIAESAEYIAKVVRQRLQEIGVDTSSEAKPATDDHSERVSLIADTIVALQTAGIVPTVTQLQSAESTVTPAPDKSKSKHSDAKQPSGNESTDIVPKLSANSESIIPEKTEQANEQDKRGRIGWKKLIEQYSIAINDLNEETFELDEGKVCAEYLKRWMDALKIGFKRKEGRIKFGADKIADAIPKFILVITQSIIDGKFDDFKEDFQRWELRARGEDKSATLEMMSHGLPYMVYHAYDDIKRYAANDYANAVYRDFLDGSLRSVSRMRNGKERCEYLSTSAISALIKDALHTRDFSRELSALHM